MYQVVSLRLPTLFFRSLLRWSAGPPGGTNLNEGWRSQQATIVPVSLLCFVLWGLLVTGGSVWGPRSRIVVDELFTFTAHVF